MDLADSREFKRARQGPAWDGHDGLPVLPDKQKNMTMMTTTASMRIMTMMMMMALAVSSGLWTVLGVHTND